MEKSGSRIYFETDREREMFIEGRELAIAEEKASAFNGLKTTVWTNGRGYYLQGKEKRWHNEDFTGVYTEYTEWMDWDEIHERWRQEGKE